MMKNILRVSATPVPVVKEKSEFFWYFCESHKAVFYIVNYLNPMFCYMHYLLQGGL